MIWDQWGKYQSAVQGLTRIIVGFLFFTHGGQGYLLHLKGLFYLDQADSFHEFSPLNVFCPNCWSSMP